MGIVIFNMHLGNVRLMLVVTMSLMRTSSGRDISFDAELSDKITIGRRQGGINADESGVRHQRDASLKDRRETFNIKLYLNGKTVVPSWLVLKNLFTKMLSIIILARFVFSCRFVKAEDRGIHLLNTFQVPPRNLKIANFIFGLTTYSSFYY